MTTESHQQAGTPVSITTTKARRKRDYNAGPITMSVPVPRKLTKEEKLVVWMEELKASETGAARPFLDYAPVNVKKAAAQVFGSTHKFHAEQANGAFYVWNMGPVEDENQPAF